jgi:hypothetical protein
LLPLALISPSSILILDLPCFALIPLPIDISFPVISWGWLWMERSDSDSWMPVMSWPQIC